jgi:hypothetical protein
MTKEETNVKRLMTILMTTRPMPEETKLKIAAALRGVKKTAEHCAAITAGKVGKKRARFTDAHRKNMSAVRIGRTFSEQHKESMRAAQQRRRDREAEALLSECIDATTEASE